MKHEQKLHGSVACYHLKLDLLSLDVNECGYVGNVLFVLH